MLVDNREETKKRYEVVSGSPLLDSLIIGSLFPLACVFVALNLTWVANLILIAYVVLPLSRGQNHYLNAERNLATRQGRFIAFFMLSGIALITLGFLNVLPLSIYIPLAIAVAAANTYLASRYAPWVREIKEGEFDDDH